MFEGILSNVFGMTLMIIGFLGMLQPRRSAVAAAGALLGMGGMLLGWGSRSLVQVAIPEAVTSATVVYVGVVSLLTMLIAWSVRRRDTQLQD